MTAADPFAEIHPAFTPQEALVESNRCLFCFDAPCTGACPTHIDVPRFIKKISTGNVLGSADTILASNILGLSCSRVCPVEVLCEGACVMHRYNRQPIEIGRLQRFAMDRFYASGAGLHPAGRFSTGPVSSVACIGGGPASLSCAAELRRNGVAATIFEKRPLAGGLNTYGVAQYKFTPADSQREVELVKSLGVEFVLGAEVGDFAEIESRFDAVFIGVGLGPTLPLEVDGETLPGVVDALQFIADYKSGRPAVGKRVAVVGGGNTAIDAAVAALRLGAEQCSLIYRRSEHEMPAFRFEFERARQEGARFVWQAAPVKVAGGSSGVEGLDCIRMELGPPDRSGRRSPLPVEGSSFRIPCDMMILSIGQSKLLGLLEQCKGVGLNHGRVAVNPETGQTANPRYFAGGDCVNGGREVVDAVAEGKRAARGILAWLPQEAAHHG